MAGLRGEGGGIGIRLLVGSAILGGLVTGGFLVLRQVSPGIWSAFASDSSISNLITTIVGSIIGTGLAVLVAYAILRAQILADRTLASETYETSVVHEVGGELAVWAAGLKKPEWYQSDTRLPTDGPTEVLRALTSRRYLLEQSDVESADNLIIAIRQLEADRGQLVKTHKALIERRVRSTSLAKSVGFAFDLGAELDAEWVGVSTELEKISLHARRLGSWKPGGGKILFDFTEGSRVSATIDVEKRMLKKGHEIVQDPFAKGLGFYEDDPKEGAQAATESSPPPE